MRGRVSSSLRFLFVSPSVKRFSDSKSKAELFSGHLGYLCTLKGMPFCKRKLLSWGNESYFV